MTTERKIEILKAEIPNLLDYFAEGELGDYAEKIDTEEEDYVTSCFVDNIFDDGYRRCDECGKLMQEGYLLYSYYACSDECRNALYKRWNHLETDEDAEKAYYFDYWSVEEIPFEEWLKMGLNECVNYTDGSESDNCFWTQWI